MTGGAIGEGAKGMAAEGPQNKPTSAAVNAPFAATMLFFLAFISGSFALRTRLGVDPLVPIGLALLVMPLTLMTAWRLGRSQAQESERLLRELIRTIDNLAQEGGLSEAAKRVLHRRQERELLRRAIEQDITDGDWDAAMVLVKELAERFGYRQDAEEFRGRIERVRAQTMDKQAVEALGVLDEVVRQRRWSDAFAEAARITRLFPDSHRVDNLRERVEEARVRHRKELERRFLHAAEQERPDEAMELLRELDTYLTPAEAAPFQEVARGVIGKLRENLGVRFKLAVQDHVWHEAIHLGERIIADFPNTRMAQEVRDLLPSLRERAQSVVRTGVGARG